MSAAAKLPPVDWREASALAAEARAELVDELLATLETVELAFDGDKQFLEQVREFGGWARERRNDCRSEAARWRMGPS